MGAIVASRGGMRSLTRLPPSRCAENRMKGMMVKDGRGGPVGGCCSNPSERRCAWRVWRYGRVWAQFEGRADRIDLKGRWGNREARLLPSQPEFSPVPTAHSGHDPAQRRHRPPGERSGAAPGQRLSQQRGLHLGVRGGSPTDTLTPDLAEQDHHLMSEDTTYLNLPRVARPDTITTRRGEVGTVSPLLGPDLRKNTPRLRHLRAGDLFNPGPISVQQWACVTAA